MVQGLVALGCPLISHQHLSGCLKLSPPEEGGVASLVLVLWLVPCHNNRLVIDADEN